MVKIQAERTDNFRAMHRVIDHPGFYPRFGFRPARQKKLDTPLPVPDEAFLVCELAPDALKGIEGMATFPPEFEGIA